MREVAAALDKLEEAYYVVICSGTLDLIVEVMCRDDGHLIDLTAEIRGIPGVVGTETHGFLELDEVALRAGSSSTARRRSPKRQRAGRADPRAAEGLSSRSPRSSRSNGVEQGLPDASHMLCVAGSMTAAITVP